MTMPTLLTASVPNEARELSPLPNEKLRVVQSEIPVVHFRELSVLSAELETPKKKLIREWILQGMHRARQKVSDEKR